MEKHGMISERERFNMLRTIGDLVGWLSLGILANLLLGLGDDDDWWSRFIALSLMRTQKEIGSIIPVNPEFIRDNWKTLKSPTAAIGWAENAIDLQMRLLSPRKWDEVYKGGKYSGENKLVKSMERMLPGVRQYEAMKDPISRLPFYQNNW
jgi:hypothetical protein